MINRKYLPSKKFIIALSLAVFLVLVAIAFSYIKPSGTRYDNDNLVAANATSSLTTIDSDHDGLPDWEEALYGTDPHNPDTDGDGTPDGEEIKEGRDPLKANTAPKGAKPNDYIDPKIIAQDQAISTVDQNLNATEKMARDLISNIIASQPANGQMDSGTQETLVQQALNDIPQKQFTGSTTVADLHLIPIDQSTAKAELTAYANSYYAATEPLQKLLGQDIALAKTAVANGTTTDQKALGKIVTQYQTIARTLVQMPLPAISGSSGITYHLAIINDLQALAAIDSDIINSGEDMVNMYADIMAYNGILNDLTGALSTVDTVLGITRQ